MVLGWMSKYEEILDEFGYDRRSDAASARRLEQIIGRSGAEKKLSRIIRGRNVAVVGSGPSVLRMIPAIRKFGRSGGAVIAADSAAKPLIENRIIPDIIVTDLDGDRATLMRAAAMRIVFVVHAHGDNMRKLALASRFRDRIGTTQGRPFGRIKNYGGFTDGDRAVFLANHFGARSIVLFGMEFGTRIGRYSGTKKSERQAKLAKLNKGRELLEWLAPQSGSKLYTTAGTIAGFKRVQAGEL